MRWNVAITEEGRALLAKIPGEIFTFTRAQCGAGIIDLADLENQTKISGYKKDLPIVKITSLGPKTSIRVRLTNDDVHNSFQLTQIGIFASIGTEPDVLYCIMQIKSLAESDHIPANDEHFVNDYLISTVISNAASIVANIDSSAFATVRELETKADLINGVVPSEEMPIASNDILGAVQLSVDFKLNADGSLAVNKGKIGGTGNVPIELSNGQAAAEIELPIKFNDSGEVIMTDDGTGTGIVSLQEVGNKLEFVAKNVL